MPEEKKKNWFARHKILTGFIVIIVIIGIAGSGKSSPSSTSGESNTSQNETANSAPVSYEKVDTKALVDAFDKNQLSAESMYKDKPLELTAKIKNISEDIMGTPFLSLIPKTADQYYYGTSIQCLFKNKEDLMNVSNDEAVTVQGTLRDQTAGIIVIKDCKIVK